MTGVQTCALPIYPVGGAPGDLAARLSETLGRLTGARWSVAVTDAPGAPTLAASRAADEADAKSAAAAHPLVQAALETFPGAEIRAVRPLDAGPPAPDAAEVLAPAPERDDIDGDLVDDDPFEEM